MQKPLKMFLFSVSKASSAVAEELAIAAESRESAELDLRVLGIMVGGIVFEFLREIGHGVDKIVPVR